MTGRQMPPEPPIDDERTSVYSELQIGRILATIGTGLTFPDP
jgi:hypothetical protein